VHSRLHFTSPQPTPSLYVFPRYLLLSSHNKKPGVLVLRNVRDSLVVVAGPWLLLSISTCTSCSSGVPRQEDLIGIPSLLFSFSLPLALFSELRPFNFSKPKALLLLIARPLSGLKHLHHLYRREDSRDLSHQHSPTILCHYRCEAAYTSHRIPIFEHNTLGTSLCPQSFDRCIDLDDRNPR
jgi:hypothetical protein